MYQALSPPPLKKGLGTRLVKRILLLSAYFLVATCYKHMRLTTSFYGIPPITCVFNDSTGHHGYKLLQKRYSHCINGEHHYRVVLSMAKCSDCANEL